MCNCMLYYTHSSCVHSMQGQIDKLLECVEYWVSGEVGESRRTVNPLPRVE